MKKFILILLSLLLIGAAAFAAPLDEIQEYHIQVNPRHDGSLDMQFHIRWKVLNASKEGPLTWVRVGIPNSHVSEITPLSGNIEKIAYSGSGGDYVRIDLEREYFAGEYLDIDFSIRQAYVSRLKDGKYIFDYTPGWFDDIEVKEIEIRWEADDLASSDSDVLENGYYVWRGSLKPGRRMNIRVSYPESRFEDVQLSMPAAPGASDDRFAGGGLFILIILLFVRVSAVLLNEDNKPAAYYRYRGFAGTDKVVRVGETDALKDVGVDTSGVVFGTNENQLGYRHYHIPRTHSHGGRVGCACACACACAGGGRAGCSQKDTYQTK